MEIKRQKKDGRNFKNNGRISKDCGRKILRDARFYFTQKVPKLIKPEDLCVSQLMQFLHLDFNFDATGQFELHQSVNSLSCAAVDVDKTLVGAHLELFAALLVNEG